MSRTFPILILALSACGEPEDTGPGLTQQNTNSGVDATCNVVVETPLGLTDTGAEFEFTPQDLIDQVQGDWGDLMEWPQPYNTTGLAANITYDGGDVVYYEREIDGVPTLDLGASCITAIEVDVVLSIQSDDGALDEVLAVTLVATVRDRASYSIVVDAADIMGTWTPEFSDVDVSGYDSWNLEISGQATDIGTSGVLTVQGTNADGSVDEVYAGEWAPPISPS